jgi:hypothetical protein
VIIMTGDTVNKDTRRFLERTGLRCIEKPFRLEDIWDCVRDLEGPSSILSDPPAQHVPPRLAGLFTMDSRIIRIK